MKEKHRITLPSSPGNFFWKNYGTGILFKEKGSSMQVQ
jgi:hypothetical protein